MEIEIYGEFIKLSQFLKKIDLTSTGGMTKFFIKAHIIKINGKIAEGRNTKIKIGDTVWIDDNVYKIVAKKD
ncbi:RNA-binding S4 domain-containing protein [[Mycoplasma] anseris]|uniref:RNA-binding S4 domain-containing protein n=1 Tax=[Mycoplasma] anseris TaxID=92400 RepID=A0A2Z4NDJ9_9BACT|nr:RNA-binding S4 domain-containing protein [[Mycoplasma] anseris]AWX69619.1 RNA-binding S4 domain-containing protein [[Mycoplasma] anseris]